MILQCPRCNTRFRFDPSRAPAGGAKVRCSVCGHVFLTSAPAAATLPAPIPEASSPPPAPRSPAAPPVQLPPTPSLELPQRLVVPKAAPPRPPAPAPAPLPPPAPVPEARSAAADAVAELAEDSAATKSGLDNLEVDFDDSGVSSPLDDLGEAFPGATTDPLSTGDTSASTSGSLPEVSSDIYEIPQVGEPLGTLEAPAPVRHENDRTRTYQASAQQLAELARPEHTHSVAGPDPTATRRPHETEPTLAPTAGGALGKRRSSGTFAPLRAITNVATTLVLGGALVAGLAVLLVRTGRLDPSWLGMAASPDPATTLHGASDVPDVTVASLVSVLYPRAHGGPPLLVATGELENHGTTTRQHLEVVLELRDADGLLVASEAAPLGGRLELHELAQAHTQAELDSLETTRASTTGLPSSARHAYMVAIAEPPGDVAELRHSLRVRERTPPTVTPATVPVPVPVPVPEPLPAITPAAPNAPEPASVPANKAKTWKMKKAWKAKRGL